MLQEKCHQINTRMCFCLFLTEMELPPSLTLYPASTQYRGIEQKTWKPICSWLSFLFVVFLILFPSFLFCVSSLSSFLLSFFFLHSLPFFSGFFSPFSWLIFFKSLKIAKGKLYRKISCWQFHVSRECLASDITVYRVEHVRQAGVGDTQTQIIGSRRPHKY